MIKFEATRNFLSNCYKNNIKNVQVQKLFKNCTYILTSKDRQKPDLDSYFDHVTFALIYEHSQRLLYTILDP